jgi:hypothetical protein
MLSQPHSSSSFPVAARAVSRHLVNVLDTGGRKNFPRKPACFHVSNQHIAAAMGLPTEPVTLSVDQIQELNRKMATLRHDINNNLTLIIAAMELIRTKPEMADKMFATMNEQPRKISTAMAKFSEEFERSLGITRGG